MQVIEIIYIIFAYLLCAIPFGVVLSKMVSGTDVRSAGSGNIGATNVARVMGKKWGVIVLVLDALKGFIAVGLAKHVGPDWYCNVVAALAVVAHCYPVYLRFRGGKGVATGLGAVAALSWPVIGVCVLVFALVIGVSRRVSAGSLAGVFALPVAALILRDDFNWICGLFLCLLVSWKHRENIRRLLARTEPKFF